MDFLRPILAALFLITHPAFASPTASNNLGIAFIHGTNDHREDADGDYWKHDFIQSVSLGLTEPGNNFVVHCDFSQYMWKEGAAGCVADQLLDFIHRKSLTALTIYTHSNGGNVMRWIVSNPAFDARYFELSQTINQIIAIAPSSSGTPLADDAIDGSLFEESLGWLLGYRSDAVKQQRIGDMAIYNNELLYASQHRPELFLPFRVIVGSDVVASPLNPGSYCNGYLLNAGLKFTKSYLNPCADGFLNCTSQASAGEVWFYDIEKMDANATLSHSQSRHSCFGFDKILRDDLALSGADQ